MILDKHVILPVLYKSVPIFSYMLIHFSSFVTGGDLIKLWVHVKFLPICKQLCYQRSSMIYQLVSSSCACNTTISNGNLRHLLTLLNVARFFIILNRSRTYTPHNSKAVFIPPPPTLYCIVMSSGEWWRSCCGNINK